MTMFDSIKIEYDAGNITTKGLKKAVARKWISETQYKEICGEDYTA
jgi:hypothetical protein